MDQAKRTFFAACTAFSFCASAVQAADGGYDTSWMPGGRELIPQIIGYDARMRDLVVQPDGKLVLAGDCDVPQAETLCIARLRRDGALDLSFGPNQTGRFTFEDFTTHYPPYGQLGSDGLALQPDGRLLLAGFGQFNGANNMTVFAGTLARLTADGNLELDGTSSYTPVGFSTNEDDEGNWVEGIALQPDGKIVLAGAANRAGSDPTNRDMGVLRLNADRSYDDTFATDAVKLIAFDQGGNNDDYAESVALQRDGKIVVVGYAMVTTGANTAKEIAIARLNPDGSFDAGFGNAGRLWLPGNEPGKDMIGFAVKIDAQNRIVIAGGAQFDGDDWDFTVVRLRPDGTPDPDFNGNGRNTIFFDLGGADHDVANDLVLAGDGTIIVVGSASRSASADAFAMLRLTADGVLDSSFAGDGLGSGTFAPNSGFNDMGTGAAMGPGGLFVAGRGASGTGAGLLDFGIARIRVDHIFGNGFN
jgi:uncharacterized delta-60 repeat protein